MLHDVCSENESACESVLVLWGFGWGPAQATGKGGVELLPAWLLRDELVL